MTNEITEEDGIKMVMFLQGASETEEMARTGWDSMSDSEKATTKTVYNMCINTKRGSYARI